MMVDVSVPRSPQVQRETRVLMIALVAPKPPYPFAIRRDVLTIFGKRSATVFRGSVPFTLISRVYVIVPVN